MLPVLTGYKEIALGTVSNSVNAVENLKTSCCNLLNSNFPSFFDPTAPLILFQ